MPAWSCRLELLGYVFRHLLKRKAIRNGPSSKPLSLTRSAERGPRVTFKLFARSGGTSGDRANPGSRSAPIAGTRSGSPSRAADPSSLLRPQFPRLYRRGRWSRPLAPLQLDQRTLRLRGGRSAAPRTHPADASAPSRIPGSGRCQKRGT